MKNKLFAGVALSFALSACNTVPGTTAQNSRAIDQFSNEIAPLPKGPRQPIAAATPAAGMPYHPSQPAPTVNFGPGSGGFGNGVTPVFVSPPPQLADYQNGLNNMPLPVATSDISVVEKTTFNGTVLDANGNPIEGRVIVRSLNASVAYEEETTTTAGAFAFHHAPAGVQIEILVELPDQQGVLRRVEVLKSNKTGDPEANRFDLQVGVTAVGSPQPVVTPTATPIPTSTPQPDTTPYPSPVPTPTPTPVPTLPPLADSDFFYFSYDDSASTAGVELSKAALLRNQLPDKSLLRPWEFLNAADFDHEAQESTGLFEVSMGIWKHPDFTQAGLDNYEFGAHVSSPELSNAERRNMVLTIVLDVSGSMNESAHPEGPASKLDLAKSTLTALEANLKAGDVLNLVTFSDSAAIHFENYRINGQQPYASLIQNLGTEGGTNLEAGMKQAYITARKYYDSSKINRVVMMTDAMANVGDTDVNRVSYHTRMNNSEGIYFSGLGYGYNFNEGFLNQLTEAGKGAYYSISHEGDVKRAMGERFMGLINVAARDVKFRLDYPKALKRLVSAAEQSSQNAEAVQATNFSYNTSQFFLEQMTAAGDSNLLQQKIRLSIYYTDPESYKPKIEVLEKSVSDLIDKDVDNIKDAHLITLLTRLLKDEISETSAQSEINVIGKRNSQLAQEYLNLLNIAFKLK